GAGAIPGKSEAPPTGKGDTVAVAPAVTGWAANAPPPTVRVATLEPFQEYATATVQRARLRAELKISTKIVATNAEPLGQISSPPPGARRGEPPAWDIALVTRRITPTESDTCRRNFVNVSEVLMGTQALVIVRSKLYGALELSPRDLFLALAAEV